MRSDFFFPVFTSISLRGKTRAQQTKLICAKVTLNYVPLNMENQTTTDPKYIFLVMFPCYLNLQTFYLALRCFFATQKP